MITLYTKPVPKKQSGGRKQNGDYDSEAIIADIREDKLSIAELADKHDVDKQVIYRFRNKVKSEGDTTPVTNRRARADEVIHCE